MKILMIATFFPPDTAIAAVRPYMFAKYLTRAGHDVTVIRSGEINNKIDVSGLYDIGFCRVLSYLGDNSAAEVYRRTGRQPAYAMDKKSRYPFVPLFVKKAIEKTIKMLTIEKRWKSSLADTERRTELLKKAIDSLSDEQFDIVWSTVGNWENHDAGRYAAERFGCPWIADFRDPMASRLFQRKKEYEIKLRSQIVAVKSSDACVAASIGLTEMLKGQTGRDDINTILNGYDNIDSALLSETIKGKLVLCFTGSLYPKHMDTTPLFKALKTLSVQGRIDLDNIELRYAGRFGRQITGYASKCGVGKIITDYGYVSRGDVARIQSESDIFIVFSWNTANSQGMISGKFYESIRSKRPVLSIVAGDLKESELYRITEKYKCGLCCEKARGKESFVKLCDWIASAYDRKMNGESVEYNPSPELFTDFRYDTLTAKLERICLDLIEKKN